MVGDLLDLTDQGEPAGEEAPEGTDWDGTEAWCFFVGDVVFATQEAREGDEIQRPDDPTAPEGMVFNGWFMEDGTQLFVGDATIVANPNPQTPDVNVFASFVEAEEPIEETVRRPVEEQATEEPAEEPATEEPSEEPTEESALEESTEEPAAQEHVEEPAEEPAARNPPRNLPRNRLRRNPLRNPLRKSSPKNPPKNLSWNRRRTMSRKGFPLPRFPPPTN